MLRWTDVITAALCFNMVADCKECLFEILSAMGDQQFTVLVDCDKIVRLTRSRRRLNSPTLPVDVMADALQISQTVTCTMGRDCVAVVGESGFRPGQLQVIITWIISISF